MLKYSVCLNKEQHTIKHFKGAVLIKSENSYILRSHINLHTSVVKHYYCSSYLDPLICDNI